MPESSHEPLIRLSAALFAVHHSLTDQFFADRFGRRLDRFLESYLYWKIISDSPAKAEHARMAEAISEAIEEFSHLGISSEICLAAAQQQLLRYKLFLLKHRPTASVPTEKFESAGLPVKEAKPKIKKLNPTSEKIVSFVRSAPRVRTKDIIDQFSAMSERTVKRSLKELTKRGLLRKILENRASYYSAG